MSTQNYFVLTEAQKDIAVGFNDFVNGVAIDPRLIDSENPGAGLNTNDQADGFGVGDPVTLSGGKYVAAVRIVNDPDYILHVPDMITFLLTLPSSILENETIFLPPEE